MILVQLLAATAIAAVQPAANPAGPVTEISREDAEAMKSKCGSRKFEAFADVPTDDGKFKRTKLTLCAPDSDSHEAWISTLEKAAAAIDKNPAIPSLQKTKLLRDFRAEITRQKAMPVPQQRPVEVAATPTPAPTPAPQAQLPIATPIAAAPPKPADIPAYVPPVGVTNRLALSARCVGGGRSQPCEEMAPNERLEFRAESDIASPVTLLFRQTSRGLLGNSGKEAEVELASDGMRRGESVVLKVPRKVCSGFRSSFEVEVRTKDSKPNQSPLILGPFEMRCPS